ncbi:ExeM/NucH family extracellular endonuclease [Ornithinimicrobium panacihumi]|uniref:ExeM/NucH family extracellular endonuclease n=1 Tax=Ornithinimicrobium panacihumi TaxID=2008449 RepID=UPI003F8C8CC6
MTRPSPERAGVAAAGAMALLGSLLTPTVALAADDDPTTLDDLIISEYVEGSSNNKAVELYNGTDTAIDLSSYRLQQYTNGAATAGATFTLSGTLEPGGTFVFAHSGADPAILAVADQTSGAGLFNGDDALVLRNGDAVVDSIGQVGFDPGTEWGTGLVSTADNTLRRKADVCNGDTVPDDAYDPAPEWDGFEVNTFDGLGAHTTTCGGDGGGGTEPAGVVINEFSASTTGTDVEFLEIFGAANTDYSHLTILEVEGDSTSAALGSVASSTPTGTTDADGRWHVDLASNTLQNGTLTLLLVEGYTDQTVLDADKDGVLDEGAGLTVLDSVAVNDGGTSDLTYSETVLGVSYDGLPYAPGGGSRIPDGTDTDTAADWVRNDFDLAGIPGFEGTLVEGEALNTPGAANATSSGGGDPVDPDPVCEPVLIGTVQGSGDVSPINGQTVCIEGIVVGDFQHAGSYQGYYVQDAGDGDPATSDGIFVYAPNGLDVSEGDTVRVTGTVAEYYGLTQISLTGLEVVSTGGELPAPVELTLPVDHEAYEGMLVSFVEDLAILEYYNYARYGQVVLGYGDGTFRQYQPTAVYEPGSPDAEALAVWNAEHRITLDDGLGGQNPSFLRHPDGEAFSLTNLFRGGDTVSNVTGVLDYRFSTWAVQPTEAADYEQTNPRPAVPEVGGTTTVGSFNVLNYFTTLTSEDGNARGADTPEEFERQQAKIVAAINEMDTDIVGLIEIENNDDVAVANLVEALNAAAGEDRWAFVPTGAIGSDAITTALIYQPAEVSPVGDFALLDSSVDPRYLDDFNRPALAQTFQDVENEGLVTVVVNHLKSKGSSCDAVGDPTDPDGQGNCNGVRTDAADALGDWANSDPTGTGTDNVLIIGDLNSYDKEDPIAALVADGYADLLAQLQGEYAYSYVFDGMLGYLDYAMASSALQPLVTGADAWLINADEPTVLDYDMTHKPDAQDAIYAPDPYRSSDHDPVLVGLTLAPEPPEDTTAPELEVIVDPTHVWPPNNKWVTVDTVVHATDDSGETPTVTVTSVETNGKGDIIQESASSFRVLAVKGAVYTITYEATDAAGNTTTESVTVTVGKPAKGDKPGKPGKGGR